MKKYLLPVLVIVFFILGLLVISLSVKKQQTLRNKAATPNGIGTVSLVPLTATHNIGDLFPVSIKFNTGGASISSVALRLIYRFTGTTPELDITDAGGIMSNQLYPDIGLLSTGDWTFPIKSVIRDAGTGTVTIDFAAVDTATAGFSSTSDVTLGTMYFKANRVPVTNPISLTFDTTQSKMIAKSGSADILRFPNSGSYTIVNCIQNSPVVSLTPATQTGAANQTLNYQFVIKNMDSVTCPNETFNLTLSTFNSPTYLTWTGSLTSYSFGMAPGTSRTLTASITPNYSVASGTYPFSLYVYRETVGQPAAIATANYVVANALPTPTPFPTATPYPTPTAIGQCLSCDTSIGTINSCLSPDAQTRTVSNGRCSSDRQQIACGSASYCCLGGYWTSDTSYCTTEPFQNMAFVDFRFKLQGINSPGGSNTSAGMTFKNGSQVVYAKKGLPVFSDYFGVYQGTIFSVPLGTYSVYVKVPSYLQRKFNNTMSIVAGGQNYADFTLTPLLAGDFNDDNNINILDLGKFLSVYTQLSVPVTPSNQIYDVNNDGVINIKDIALVLVNYLNLNNPGD